MESSDLSFRITGQKYDRFEIESLDFNNGTLYFNANREEKGTSKQADMVGTFNDYNTYDK